MLQSLECQWWECTWNIFIYFLYIFVVNIQKYCTALGLLNHTVELLISISLHSLPDFRHGLGMPVDMQFINTALNDSLFLNSILYCLSRLHLCFIVLSRSSSCLSVYCRYSDSRQCCAAGKTLKMCKHGGCSS